MKPASESSVSRESDYDDMISDSNNNDIDEGNYQYYEKGTKLRLVGDGIILSENGDDSKYTKEDLDFIVKDEDLSESGDSTESGDYTISKESTNSNISKLR